MSRKKTKNTKHSYERAAERSNLTVREVKTLFKKASRARTIDTIGPGPLKDFILRKSKRNKRIKYVDGYIMVFCSTSTRCITMYKPNEKVLEAQRWFDEGKTVWYCNHCKKYFVQDYNEACSYTCPHCGHNFISLKGGVKGR